MFAVCCISDMVGCCGFGGGVGSGGGVGRIGVGGTGAGGGGIGAVGGADGGGLWRCYRGLGRRTGTDRWI